MDDFTSRVDLQKIITEEALQVLYTPDEPSKIMGSSSDVNRPGLALAGFFDHFDHKRIQILGNAESVYLKNMSEELRRERLTAFFQRNPVAVVSSHGNKPDEMMIELASYFEVPLLFTEENTSDFMAALIAYLHVQLAPQITRHGVLVEVYGEGVLITGESGAGKSEAAVELIKRGHRLIADDAVEIRKVSDKTLIGASPSNIRHFVELRGIGIINARRIFGMGAVKNTEKIDMVIQLEAWDSTKAYDRLGLDNEYTRILDIQVPVITVPITPGRNLAVIVETAAMNNRQKKMGYNAAKELMAGLGMEEIEPEDKELEIWKNS